jgi:hypothetical protein
MSSPCWEKEIQRVHARFAPVLKLKCWLPTRLADGTVTIAVENLNSPFTNEPIEALPVAGRWLKGVSIPEGPINVPVRICDFASSLAAERGGQPLPGAVDYDKARF